MAQKNETYLVGQCKHCFKPIYSNQKFVVMDYAPGLDYGEYLTGPVHQKCKKAALVNFNTELRRLIWEMRALIELFSRGKNGNI